jgi:hypothetical protein
MRVHLTARLSPQQQAAAGKIPVELKIRPACGLPGAYEYSTDSATLLRLLQKGTDLPMSVLLTFEASLRTAAGGKLLGVDLSDGVLTEIGYFID